MISVLRLRHGTTWLHPAKLTSLDKKSLYVAKRYAPALTGVWLSSSGTESLSVLKLIALEWSALEASAIAVNQHLQVTGQDHWLNVLPTYHVGGLGVHVRAYVAGCKLSDLSLQKWDAHKLTRFVRTHGVTLTSLVPTQVFDLCQNQLTSPQSLRAVVVGGGALAPQLFLEARRLGWPILPSYGLSECASQVATAPLSSLHIHLNVHLMPKMHPLSHVEWRLDLPSSTLWLRSPSLCRWVARVDANEQWSCEDPRRAGWFPTQDVIQSNSDGWDFIGRFDSVLKIFGELVSIAAIEQVLSQHLPADLLQRFCVLPTSDARQGWKLFLVSEADPEGFSQLRQIVTKYNQNHSAPQHLHGIYFVPQLPRSALNKIKRAELAHQLGL